MTAKSTRLPPPSPEELAHTAELEALLRSEIERDGPVDFARFMAQALYAPGLGYYSAGARKLGAGGDFTTAPELGDLFAHGVAHAIAPILRETAGDVLEPGAGSGALAADLLLALERHDALPARYRILEPSADLRERQRATIAARAPAHVARVEWLDAPPPDAWRGALVANEVLDALPVRAFQRDTRGVHARAVEWRDGRFAWTLRPADAALAARVETLARSSIAPWPATYRSEYCAMLPAWIAETTRALERGVALFVDYGYARREYYLPERSEGTLVCHYRHRAHDDPLVLVGLQDITAFVDFTAVAEAGIAAGLELAAWLSQAQFLFACGLAERLGATSELPATERLLLAQQAKRLTLPGEMGERFQAIAFVRDIDLELLPFAAFDRSARL
ncbi:MAG TPA: SAM-dependent methyltransferase [Xanthomonadales bacterium]|nr:SAM-dependent methyltransferase [Xanthomonadales bacterium]